MERRENTDLGLQGDIFEMAKSCGIESKWCSGSYIFADKKKVFGRLNEKYRGAAEILDINDALEKYGGLGDFYWKLVSPDKNEYTRMVSVPNGGYFIRVFEGRSLELPLESCIILRRGEEQFLHNIVIAEPGSSVTIMSGCTAHESLRAALHVGVSEFFVGKNASVSFTMVHNWTENSVVRPATAVNVEEGGKYLSNYLCLKPVKDLRTFPKVICEKGAQAIFKSVLYGKGNSSIEIGEDIELRGEDSRAEITSRSVLEDSAKIITRGRILGLAKAKGHIECNGILLSDRAELRSIPEIAARNPEVDLSHEAAIGKIAEKELLYLMSRGLSREEATNLIVRGFMKLPGMGLPEWIEREISG
ncbi:MAG: SufB/SufD family protein [Candidatus Aenigmatarchaeota archaeon]